MSKDKPKDKHGAGDVPDGYSERTVLFEKRSYARRKNSTREHPRWKVASRSKPGQWHHIEDNFGLAMNLENLWDDQADLSEGRSSSSESAEEPKKKKGPRADNMKQTGQDSHGRIWLYDSEEKRGHRWYCVLGLFQDTKRDGLVNAEFITTGRRATHVLGETEMTLLLRKVSTVFKNRYGEKKMQEIIYPNIRVIKTEKK